MYTECFELCGNKKIELSEVCHIENLTLSGGKFPNVCCWYRYSSVKPKGIKLKYM